MNLHTFIPVKFVIFFFSLSAAASDTIRLETTTIKADKESPAILYIVPWKEMRDYNDQYQGLMIDDLQEDILKPDFPGRELLTR